MKLFLYYIYSSVIKFRLPKSGITMFGVGALSYSIFNTKRAERVNSIIYNTLLKDLRETKKESVKSRAENTEIKDKLELLEKGLNKVTEMSENVGKKITEYTNFLPSLEDIKSFFNNYLDFLYSFSVQDQLILLNILSSVLLLSLLFSSLLTNYSNYLIDYYNLSNKFPKIAKYLALRQKLSIYYLKWNIFIGTCLLLNMIFINAYVLFF